MRINKAKIAEKERSSIPELIRANESCLAELLIKRRNLESADGNLARRERHKLDVIIPQLKSTILMLKNGSSDTDNTAGRG